MVRFRGSVLWFGRLGVGFGCEVMCAVLVDEMTSFLLFFCWILFRGHSGTTCALGQIKNGFWGKIQIGRWVPFRGGLQSSEMLPV